MNVDVRTVIGFALALVLLFLFQRTVGSAPRVIAAVVVSGLFALGLDHVVAALQRRLGWARPRAVAVVLIVATAAVVALTLLVLPEVVKQASRLGTDVPRTIRRLPEIPVLGPVLERNEVPAKVQDWVDQLPRRLALNASPLETAGRSIVEGVLSALLMLVIGVTMLLDGERLVNGARRLVPPPYRPRADRLGRIAYVALGRYMAGGIFVALTIGVYFFVIAMVLDLPLAPLIAVWVAVTSMIPQVGGALGGIPFVLLGFTLSPSTGFVCLVVFLVHQQIQNNVIHPVVVGRTVRLSAATTTIAAIVGATAGGFVGALVAVPLVGVVKTFYLDLRFPGDEALAEESPGGWIAALLARFRRRRSNGPGSISPT